MKYHGSVFLVMFLVAGLAGCGSDGNGPDVAWDEGVASQGELSGDLSRPTWIELAAGNNYIIATSVPAATEICIDAPDGSKTPYYPEHESYTDTFTFSLAPDQVLTRIMVAGLRVEPVHGACGAPIESQLGAFAALSDRDRIDWNSDTFDDFIRSPEAYPLIGPGFAKSAGEDLLAMYKDGFGFGPYAIAPLAQDPTNGT